MFEYDSDGRFDDVETVPERAHDTGEIEGVSKGKERARLEDTEEVVIQQVVDTQQGDTMVDEDSAAFEAKRTALKSIRQLHGALAMLGDAPMRLSEIQQAMNTVQQAISTHLLEHAVKQYESPELMASAGEEVHLAEKGKKTTQTSEQLDSTSEAEKTSHSEDYPICDGPSLERRLFHECASKLNMAAPSPVLGFLNMLAEHTFPISTDWEFVRSYLGLFPSCSKLPSDVLTFSDNIYPDGLHGEHVTYHWIADMFGLDPSKNGRDFPEYRVHWSFMTMNLLRGLFHGLRKHSFDEMKKYAGDLDYFDELLVNVSTHGISVEISC